MARVTVEDCLENISNRMELIVLASKRARQLLDGSDPLISNVKGNKEVVLALREIAAGKIALKKVDEKTKKPRFKRRRINRYIRSQDQLCLYFRVLILIFATEGRSITFKLRLIPFVDCITFQRLSILAEKFITQQKRH